MTDYVKSTNFASKDSLAVGNPLKIVKGTEIDTEFNNIATAVTTKADLVSPTFTGTPSSTSPALSDALTRIATVATVQALYPVGSLYLNATNATNPATLLGFGTWVAFGAGRVPVGYDAANSNFNSAEKTGGSADAILVSHSHTFSGNTSEVGNHQHYPSNNGNTNGYGFGGDAYNVTRGTQDGSYQSTPTTPAGAHSHTYSGTTSTQGSSATNANLPPYITVYMWKRTA